MELTAAETLIAAIQELSLARELSQIMNIVRHCARQLTGADGATFVLKDGTYCYYADEDAIEPLWKGSRFPMSSCISGWVMMNRTPAVIPDIFADPRIPVEAYRPTFVKSLAMVPIRVNAPIAAIGNYWASHHQATEREIALLQALANSTCVAMENIEVRNELERRVDARTRELKTANEALAQTNQELESFSYSVSHDLQAPLRVIRSYAEMIQSDRQNQLTPEGTRFLERIEKASGRMAALITDMLQLARVSSQALRTGPNDLALIARETIERLRTEDPERLVTATLPREVIAHCDGALMRIVLDNLLSNAWKFTAHTAKPHIEFGTSESEGTREFFVRDNGVGFDPAHTTRLFHPFVRLHADADFPGTGVGLSTVRRIVEKHGGAVRATAQPGLGATIFFTLPEGAPA